MFQHYKDNRNLKYSSTFSVSNSNRHIYFGEEAYLHHSLLQFQTHNYKTMFWSPCLFAGLHIYWKFDYGKFETRL